MRRRQGLLLLMFVLLAGVRVAAHPHVFIDSRVVLQFSGSDLTHITAHWTFDRMFTQMVVSDFRLDRSGDFSSEQVSAVENGAFRNLENFDYYTFIRVDGRRIDANRVENFHVSLDSDGRLVYTFDIPVGVSLDSGERRIEVAMYDETFFTDMVFADDYLDIRGSGVVSYTSDIAHEVHDTGLWGPMIRERVIIEVRRAM